MIEIGPQLTRVLMVALWCIGIVAALRYIASVLIAISRS